MLFLDGCQIDAQAVRPSERRLYASGRVVKRACPVCKTTGPHTLTTYVVTTTAACHNCKTVAVEPPTWDPEKIGS